MDFNKIKNFFKKKRKPEQININLDDLPDNKQYQAILDENAYLKGILVRKEAEEKKRTQETQKREEETERLRKLNEEYKELQKKEFNPISLQKILEWNKKQSPNKKIRLTTYDGNKVLGILEDFSFLADGGFGVYAKIGKEKRLIWGSKDINHVFYWVNGLANYAKNRMIPLCVNSQGQFIPNMMQEEMFEFVKKTDGKFRINRFSKKPFSEIIAKNQEEISGLSEELGVAEETISEQQEEIRDSKREARVHKSRAEEAESRLSLALGKVAEIEKANSQIVRENMTLLNLKEIYEDIVNRMEKVVKIWGEKIEGGLGATEREKIWEELRDLLEWAKRNMPQEIYMAPEKEPPPTLSETVKPKKP